MEVPETRRMSGLRQTSDIRYKWSDVRIEPKAAKNGFEMALADVGDGTEDYVPQLVDFVACRNVVPPTA